jgi:asparagine synthase (glutamine-hydrolysing)
MRLQCIWGRASPARDAADDRDTAEQTSIPLVGTLKAGEADCELTLHFAQDGSHPTRVWRQPNGSLIAVTGEIFGEGDAIGRPIPLNGLLDQITRSPQSAFAALNSAATILTWDARTRELCVARDRHGAAHVFYARSGNGLIIATDIEAILRVGFEGSLDYQALDCFLARGFVPAPLTFLKEVRKLAPAQMLRVRPGEEPIIESYFRPTVHPEMTLIKRDRLHGIRTRLRDAVDRRRIASGEMGVLLSSGIDSALVLATAHEIGIRLRAFTFDYTDYSGPFNEGEPASALASHFNVPHQLVACRPQDIVDSLPRLAANYGEPLTYGLHSVMLGALKDHGIETALTGVGADCFGISDSGFGSILFQQLPKAMRRAAHALIAATAEFSPDLASKVYALLWSDRHDLPSCLHPALMTDDLRLALLRDQSAATTATADTIGLFRQIAGAFTGEPAIASWRFTGQRCFASEGPLFWNQVWSRSSGVELRHPFFDNALQEYVMRLGKFGRGKLYIRELAAEMLPAWSAQTPKLHHTIPIGHWFRGPLRETLEDYLSEPVLRDHFDVDIVARLKHEHLTGIADHAWRLWALVSFVAWQAYALKPARTTATLKSLREHLAITAPAEPRTSSQAQQATA